jgi:putative hydrolase of the HAD superfamily
LRAACVSNSDGRAEAHLERFGLREGLEFVVDSALVGVEKPDPRIFRIALDRMGIPAGRALYVGDIRAGDEVGSRAAGMHFVLLDPFGDYASDGVAAIPDIERLPRYVSEHFDVRGSRSVPRGTAAARDAT